MHEQCVQSQSLEFATTLASWMPGSCQVSKDEVLCAAPTAESEAALDERSKDLDIKKLREVAIAQHKAAQVLCRRRPSV